MGQVYSRLSEEERQVIRIEMGNGAGVRRMAMMRGRHASAVGREIRRDTWFPSDESESCRPCRPRRLRTGPWTGRCHVAGPARRRAMRREAVARRPRRLASGRLWTWVAERLRRGRSPLPICGRLAMEHSGGPVMRCRPEAVCRWVYADKARRKRRADGVIGTGCSLHTEVERRTRFPMAAIVPDKTAAASVAAQKAMFSRLPAAARTGVTHDDGTEFARHAELRDEPGMATYFADPHSSWRRGGNENRNGMIRRYPPKRTPIAPSMARELLESAENKDVTLTNR